MAGTCTGDARRGVVMDEQRLAEILDNHSACPPVDWRDCYDSVEKRCVVVALVAEVRRLRTEQAKQRDALDDWEWASR
jgi:hypothetical protein